MKREQELLKSSTSAYSNSNSATATLDDISGDEKIKCEEQDDTEQREDCGEAEPSEDKGDDERQ